MTPTGPLDHLVGATPHWFAPSEITTSTIDGRAEVRALKGVRMTVADLRITVRDQTVKVGEVEPGTVFPAECPERHLNGDRTFCIGYGAGASILTSDDAVVWWGLLEEYLRLQGIAQRTRRWPARKAIAHSSAGAHHVLAFQAAQALGLEEDYYQMLEGEPKWFVSPEPGWDEPTSPCPLGCARNGVALTRGDCSRTGLLDQLVREDRLRVQAESEFWSWCRAYGMKCCGTMADCPLPREP